MKPDREEFEQYYLKENHSYKETKKHFNLSTKSFYELLSQYKIVKSKELQQACQKKTLLERYGVDNVRKIKEIDQRIKQTNLEKYGSASPFGSKEIQSKTQQTFKEKYGCHPRSTKEVRDKQRQTNLEKYGVENVAQHKDIRNKISSKLIEANKNPAVIAKRKQTNLEKYGVEFNTQQHLPQRTLEILSSAENFKAYILSLPELLRNKHFIAEDLQVHTTNIGPKLHEWGLDNLVNYNPYYSSGQLNVMNLLDEWGITYLANDRHQLSPQEIDIFIPHLNIGIEFNGNFYHRDEHKGKGYHQKKSLFAQDKGIFIYHIFQYEWEDESIKSRIIYQLRNLLQLNEQKIGARQCMIKEISAKETRDFLNQYHLQGADNAPIRYGLFYKEELVSCMTFCKPRFNKKYDWELSRYCCKGGVTISGGASKLFKHFIKEQDPGNVLSYSDISKTRGNIYSQLGFRLDHLSKPNYIWCKRHRYLTRYQCQKHKLVKEFPQYKDLSESEIMSTLGFWKIEDCGNAVYVWTSELYELRKKTGNLTELDNN